MSNFYSGSKIFQPVSDAFGLTVDQVRIMLYSGQLGAMFYVYVSSTLCSVNSLRRALDSFFLVILAQIVSVLQFAI